MAKKIYAVRIGRKPGLYDTWDEAKAQVDGFAGARYKGFTDRAEAEAFMANDTYVPKSATKATPATDIVDSARALANLKQVVVGDKEPINIESPQVMAACKDQLALVMDAFDEAYRNPTSVEELSGRDDVITLMARYSMDLRDYSAMADASQSFQAIAFVDGGGDKVGANFESTRIVFGAVFYDAREDELSLYRYVLEKGTQFDWLFRASNVAGEELAALLSMYVAKQKGLNSLCIYQDNNLPAKYYSGAFKKIHNLDDYMLQLFITESINYIRNGMEINFIYVPSEHAAQANKAKLEKGKATYEAQDIPRLSFNHAEFYNGISDRLADYRG